jgi:hypothetical protein
MPIAALHRKRNGADTAALIVEEAVRKRGKNRQRLMREVLMKAPV